MLLFQILLAVLFTGFGLWIMRRPRRRLLGQVIVVLGIISIILYVFGFIQFATKPG